MANFPKTSARRQVSGKNILQLMLALLVLVIAVFGGVVVLGLLMGVDGRTIIMWLAVGIFIFSALVVCLMLVFSKRHRIAFEELGMVKPSWRIFHLLWQIPAIMTAALFTQFIILQLLSGVETSGNNGTLKELANASPSSVLVVLALLSTGILTPLWEEVFFRGYVWSWLRSRFSVVLAVIFNAALFAVFHGFIVLAPYYFVLGCGLAWLRHFHGNIWVPIIFHAILNSAVSLAILSTAF